MQSIFHTFTQILPTPVDLFTAYLDSIIKSERGGSRTINLNLFLKHSIGRMNSWPLFQN